jgi:hypothetical protein
MGDEELYFYQHMMKKPKKKEDKEKTKKKIEKRKNHRILNINSKNEYLLTIFLLSELKCVTDIQFQAERY